MNEENEKLINTEEIGVVDKVYSEENTKRLISSSQIGRYCGLFIISILILAWLLILTVLYLKLKHADNDTLRTKVDAKNGQTTTDMKDLSTFRNSIYSKIGQMITDTVNNKNTNIVNMVNTQENLGRARNEFVLHLNRSIHSQIQGVAKSQNSSVKNINERIGSFRKEFESNKILGATERKTTDEKLSKTKAEFRESLKEEKEATSALEKKMMRKQENLEEGQHSQQKQIDDQKKTNAEFRESLKAEKEATSAWENKMMTKQENLEEGQHSQQKTMDEKLSKTKAEFRVSLKEEREATSASEKKIAQNQEGQHSQQNQIDELRKELNKLKNKASGYLRVNVPLILTTALVLFSIFTLN